MTLRLLSQPFPSKGQRPQHPRYLPPAEGFVQADKDRALAITLDTLLTPACSGSGQGKSLDTGSLELLNFKTLF